MHIRVTYHLSVGNLPNTRAEEYAKEFERKVLPNLSPVERLLVVTHREEAGGTWSERHLVPDNWSDLADLVRAGVFRMNA